MWLKLFSTIFIYYLVNQRVSDGANILVHLPTQGRSHFKPFEPLFMELAGRGHNLTVISAFPPERQVINYSHLQVHPDLHMISVPMAELRKQNRLENYLYLHSIVQNFSLEMINESHTRNLLNSDVKFDLIMMELYHFDMFFSLASRFNAPIIGISFQPLLSVYNWISKNPWSFSYVPNLYLPFSDRMNFLQRFINTVFGCFTILYYNLVSLSVYQNEIDSFMKSNGVRDVPKIEDVTKNLSLIFVESHFAAGYVRPYLPNVVEVAGIHIPPQKDLPEDIENFISETDEFVYISLGTLIDPSSIDRLGVALTEIFEKLTYKVLWKWDPKLLANIPKNFLVRKWLPQADILRNPKCKLFISHGGYHSIVETINGGVPILCLPFFTDQHHNARIIEDLEIGKKGNPDSTAEELFTSIKELLMDQSYRERAQLQSVIFKDRPIKPLDLAVYWTEYVIRHKGAPHLKSAATKLRWYQYLLLDVIFFALIISLATYYLCRIIIKSIFKLLKSFFLVKKIKTH